MQSTQTPHSSQCTKKVKWQAANQVGVPNLYLHKYHLYHSRCTSSIRKPLTSNRHLKDSPQGLQVKFGMEFSSLEWQGKTSTANTYHAWAKIYLNSRVMCLWEGLRVVRSYVRKHVRRHVRYSGLCNTYVQYICAVYIIYMVDMSTILCHWIISHDLSHSRRACFPFPAIRCRSM